ncbi:MAG: succinate dehydrogenase cytochrome b subunit [candidate division Zixibacteria bacterium]
MASLTAVFFSSIGKKFINAVSGFFLVIFLCIHLLGNITLLTGNADAFNAYAHFLMGLGILIYISEFGLVLFFALHIITATSVWWDQQVARPVAYKNSKSAGDTSKKTLSSSTMIYTGAIILVFSILHLITLKYGPGVAEGYTTDIDGVVMRDLYRLTVDVFAQPWYTASYVLAMILMGFHLRHGVWSMFQSLGLNRPKFTSFMFKFAILVAFILAFGFIVIPVVLYLKGGAL